MSYAQFLVLFLGVPLVAGAALVHTYLSRRLLLTLAAVSVVALLYTGPWDNLIIIDGVWSYGRHQILGIVIGHVPLEEYIFYVLQVFLTGMVTVFFLRRVR